MNKFAHNLSKAFTWAKNSFFIEPPFLILVVLLVLGGVYAYQNSLQHKISTPQAEIAESWLQITVPTDRKMNTREVSSALWHLENLEPDMEERAEFIKAKTKEIWDNLGISSRPESGWSSWHIEHYYPTFLSSVNITESIDILNSSGKEDVIEVQDLSNFRYLMFDRDGNFLGSIEYEFQKYKKPKYWPIMIG